MLLGRDPERARIGALLDAARESRGGALLIRGEPGIGKTALLQDTRDRATDMHVLTARGIESESELAFAGLHQLLRPALELLDRLPEPQAGALRAAFGLAERPGDDRFLISMACLTLLAELAERRPVLCLIDDAQWLDTPSADALLFVARRLDADGIVLLFGAREPTDRRFEAPGVDELDLGALETEDAARLVNGRFGEGVAPQVRDLLVREAGGNALALVELPAALTPAQREGREPLPESLPLTRDVERLFLERVRRLPADAQRLLLLVAADHTGSLAPIMQAADALGIGPESLTAAERANLVGVRGVQIVAHHPLVRSAVYQAASSSERRSVHLALAEALAKPQEADQRAWHRAAAALGPDAEVADELERTAERAGRRSGHAAAAAAFERAASVSPDAASQARRLVAAASEAWQAGQPQRASGLLDRAEPLVSDVLVRADLDHLRGVMAWRCGRMLDGCETLMAGAANVATADPRRALQMLFDGANAGVDAGDYSRVDEAGQRAAALALDAAGERPVLAELLIGVGSLIGGKSADEVPLVLDVIARADEFDDSRWLLWASVGASAVGNVARGAELLRRAVQLARASGAVDMVAAALITTVVEGVVAGRYAVAAEATEGLHLSREAGLRNPANVHRAVLAWLAAVSGDDDTCRAYAAEVAAEARPNGYGLANALAEWALALLDLSAGRADDAVTRLEAVRTAPPGVGHPYIALMSMPDLVEAGVRSGHVDAARAAFAVLAGFAGQGAPDWALAFAARCRGLLSEDAGADESFDEALRLHSVKDRLFDRARTELLFGEYLRRNRRRAESRDHLRAAVETFESLGAAPWAERARTELRASGETARKRDPSTVSQLTPQELQVARIVAEGLSNKEVAAQLFLSPRTIDAHLRNVFAKLGIASRTQLARLLGEAAQLSASEVAAVPA